MQESGSTLARHAGAALTWKAIQAGGTRGLFLVRTLILARLLSPDDFGLLAIAAVAVTVLVSITDLGMTPALVQQPQPAEAHYDSAWTVNLVRALCVSTFLIATAPTIAFVFAEPQAAAVLRWLALKPLVEAAASVKLAELTRNLNVRRLTFVKLPAAMVETIASVVLASRFGVWALVAGALAGAVATVVMSYILAPHRPRFVLTSEAVRPLMRYGRWVFLTGVVAICATSLTQVVISRRLGAVELGLYFLAAKLAFLPDEIASQVVGEVAFSVYARVQHDRASVEKAFRSILLGTTTFLLPAYVLLIGLAPWLVDDILGDRWRGTESLVQVLAVAGIVGLFGSTTVPLFRGLGHPKWILAIEVLQSSLTIVFVWILTGRYGIVGAALGLAVAVGSSQVLSFFFVRRLLQKPLAGFAFQVALTVLASLAGAMTGAVMHWLVGSGVTGFVVAASLAACVTTVVLSLCDRHFQLGLWADVTRAFPQLAPLLGPVPATR